MRELRTQRGFTLETLAERCEMHWTYISGIERGERNPSLINIVKLTHGLRVPVAELMAGLDRKGI